MCAGTADNRNFQPELVSGPVSDDPLDLDTGLPTRIGWKQYAREYHKARAGRPSVVATSPERLVRLRRLLNDNVSLERPYAELNAADRNGQTAAATVEALMFSLRSGLAALSNPHTLGQLSELSEEQVRAVIVRLQKLQPEIAPPWTPEEVVVLLAAWGRCHGR